jgi:hypothetical protein
MAVPGREPIKEGGHPASADCLRAIGEKGKCGLASASAGSREGPRPSVLVAQRRRPVTRRVTCANRHGQLSGRRHTHARCAPSLVPSPSRETFLRTRRTSRVRSRAPWRPPQHRDTVTEADPLTPGDGVAVPCGHAARRVPATHRKQAVMAGRVLTGASCAGQSDAAPVSGVHHVE